jgi:Secretion system C-terminal sorting domain
MITSTRLKTIFTAIVLCAVQQSYGQNITTVVGTGVAGFSGDWGPPLSAEINTTNALCFGNAGTEFGSLYLVDQVSERIREVKLGAGGIIFTRAGNGTESFCGDSGPATAACVAWPGGVAVDGHFNIYIGDYNNQRVRKVTSLGIISTYAGTGVSGFSGDEGPATLAQFYNPYNVVADNIGNLYVADQYNHRIRKIDTAGIIHTVAGNGIPGATGDGGPATNASVSYPNYVHVDNLGRLYITDNGNHKIRMVDTNGIITTVAGNGTGGYSGDGGLATLAQLKYPGGAAPDIHGNLIIADAYNNVIRKVNAITHKISTIAGTGLAGSLGDGGPAVLAELNQPLDVAVDLMNNIYFSDYYNNRIRMIAAGTTGDNDITEMGPKLTVFPNPSTGIINLEWANCKSDGASIELFDITGRLVFTQSLTKLKKADNLQIDLSKFPSGCYILQFNSQDGRLNKKVFLDK